MGNRLTGALLILCLALGAVLAAEVHFGVVDTSPVPPRVPVPPPDLDAAATPEPAPVPPLATLTETVDRPLFSPERRPSLETPEVVMAAPVASAREEPPPSLVLTAVVLEPGRRLALFRRGVGDTALRALEGERVEGWTVQSVREDGVTLERDGRVHEIDLRTFRPPPPPVALPRTVRRGEQAAGAQPEAERPRRPRRPLRGPRARSLERNRAQ